MSVTRSHPDLWALVYGTPWIDADQLLEALQAQCAQTPTDHRTKVLIRDVSLGLRNHWGNRLDTRLSAAALALLAQLAGEDLGERGFTNLERRIVDATTPLHLTQFFRELGDRLRAPARLDVGGSSALILRQLLRRPTDDVDVVDEIPCAIRVEHDLLSDLVLRYGLRLAHFQSHYLPAGWASRIESLGRFGKLDVFLVDAVDIFVRKLFSKRTKDRDDLRMLSPLLDRAPIENRLRSSARGLVSDADRRDDARRNWYIVFGDDLPAGADQP